VNEAFEQLKRIVQEIGEVTITYYGTNDWWLDPTHTHFIFKSNSLEQVIANAHEDLVEVTA
jgi:hypothetical protein